MKLEENEQEGKAIHQIQENAAILITFQTDIQFLINVCNLCFTTGSLRVP
jgi:hypothetical protein